MLITEVVIGSPAYKEGQAAGMVLLIFDNQAVTELESFKAARKKCTENKPVLMLVLSARGKHLVVFGTYDKRLGS
ncbi:hypothetical protein [Adhaeretor mobilis]|uniref:hypothetical protein n=1 Tax=Adhaeretor mobilis TaxID=1930276 RepID=UPI0011A1B3E4|nr:hypothetical protein [Adhaeretor mobilis]